MKYEYSEKNRIVNPHKYMYTEYHGRPFLDAWKNDRNSFIKKDVYLLQIEDVKRELARIIEEESIDNSDSGSTEVKLRSLCIKILYNSNTRDTYTILSAYLKKYEVTKKLYTEYTEELKPADSSYDNLMPYIWLSICCGLYSFNDPNLKMINCMLKLNDCISSCRDEIEIREMKKMAMWAFTIEQAIIARVAKNCGVTL
jgi:hypothetical protein